MSYFHWITGTTLGFAWLYRLIGAARGMPKIPDISSPEWDCNSKDGHHPKVSIIVPARNEDVSIAASLSQLLNLDYDNYEVIAVNDRSNDRTGEIMEQVAADRRVNARLKVVHIQQLPHGWLGKAHAMWTAGKAATGEWLLFTDADVLFRPDSLRRAIAYAEAECADHLVVFPWMIMKTAGEKMMIAFFQTLFIFGHRPWKVADPKTKDHMGVGAFNLVRRRVYDAIGSYEALRFEVIDDMKLGKIVKNAGFAQRNVFGKDLISIRWAFGAMGVVNNLTKNFFAVMSFQWPRAVASAFALGFLNLMPFLGVWLAHGWARAPYALSLACIFCVYFGMSEKSGIPFYYVFLHPVSTLLFVYTLLRSTFLTLHQRGVIWRGTKYPLEALRKGLV
ncbi:MAG: glycosyltransferase family 2 protein [Acidobacteriota bacterium]|nr:glycosyltransferase family 2 protein [Acidobacteriota bacterium]